MYDVKGGRRKGGATDVGEFQVRPVEEVVRPVCQKSRRTWGDINSRGRQVEFVF